MPSGRQPSPLSANDLPIDGLAELSELLAEYATEYNRYCEARRSEVQLVGYRSRANADMDDIEAMRFELMDSHRNLQNLSRKIKLRWKESRSMMSRLYQSKRLT